jgi:probable rRNA maturation factor
MAALNQAFRGVPGPTDVLSFPFEEPGPESAERGSEATPDRYLGDIAISVETARRQATRWGVSLARELALLVIHGTLHLAGYDHHTPAARRRMWRVQARLLRDCAAPARGRRRPTAALVRSGRSKRPAPGRA